MTESKGTVEPIHCSNVWSQPAPRLHDHETYSSLTLISWWSCLLPMSLSLISLTICWECRTNCLMLPLVVVDLVEFPTFNPWCRCVNRLICLAYSGDTHSLVVSSSRRWSLLTLESPGSLVFLLSRCHSWGIHIQETSILVLVSLSSQETWSFHSKRGSLLHPWHLERCLPYFNTALSVDNTLREFLLDVSWDLRNKSVVSTSLYRFHAMLHAFY